MSAPSVGVRAALAALVAAEAPLPSYAVGGAVEKALVAAGGRGTGTRGSRYISTGNLAAGPLRSLNKRGWARVAMRPDGLSGSAWVVTPAGREAHAALTAERSES